jgi:anti-sigma B factor antagonist
LDINNQEIRVMSISTSNIGSVFIVTPSGRLDTNTAPEAEKLITDAIDGGESKIVVDFTETEYISSAGLRIILKTAKLLKPKNGAVVLCNANEQIEEVLEISGFLGMIMLLDSLDEATAAVNK